jgi:indolepyruvate ferredoxin oxidoreductase
MTNTTGLSPRTDLSLDEKYTREDGEILLTGRQAIVRVILDQMRSDRANGLHTAGFISGYPGSPLAGLDLELERHEALLKQYDILYQPGLNEELGATAVAGSQGAGRALHLRYDGVVGMWYAKAPGLDRAADAIRHANYQGVTRNSGALAWVGDDPACKSSTIPSSSEQSLSDMYSPVLVPGNVQEVLDYGLHGVAMSRVSALWTGIKVVTNVADGMGTATVQRGGVRPVIPEGDGVTYGRDTPVDVSFAARIAAEREITEIRLPAALHYASVNGLNDVALNPTDAWIGIVAPSHIYYELRSAFTRLGLSEEDVLAAGVRVLRLGMLFPFDDPMLRSFARGLEEIVVLEERKPFLELFVRNALYGQSDAPLVVGKQDDAGATLVSQYGALDVDAIVEPVRRRLARRLEERLAPLEPRRTAVPIAVRPPYFCSGCPHSTGAKVPEGTMVGAGIGCHGMATWMNHDTYGTITSSSQMGGEGAQFIGIAPFVEEGHFTQNVGDGTFFHSGQLALQAAIAAGLDVTYKILFNDTIAMTGGQDAPGRLTPPDIARVLLTQGVKRVAITTEDVKRYRGVSLPRGAKLYDRSKIIEVQEELQKVPGVTVLIHDQQCAAEARRLRKRGKLPDPPMRVAIVERVCEGCGDCSVKSNCMSVLAIPTDLGSKRTIDQTSCNKDYSCLDGDCPSFVTLMPAKQHWWSKPRPAASKGSGLEPIDASAISDPEPLVTGDEFAVRMTGVGGTGVVTVSQVLVTAAKVAGLEALSMDQTGLAQKGGAVVSDVHVSRTPIEHGGRVDAGGADLYLVFDAIVGALPNNLVAADAARTTAVISTSMTAAGEQTGRAGAPVIDPKPFVDAISTESRSDHLVVMDVAAVCRRLFGDTSVANVFLLGVAYQLGTLPLPADAIERALELNNVAVEKNVQAFRRGRLWVVSDVDHDAAAGGGASSVPDRLAARTSAVAGADDSLLRTINWRVADLVAFQDERLATSYVDFLEQIASRSEMVRPGDPRLVDAVARNLYKLTAYKDEYEVARLMLDPSTRADVDYASGGRPMRASWNLHPPLLRAMGMKKKIRLGPWFRPMFVLLYKLRRLRGKRLDIFGYAKVRRLERELVREYRKVLDDVTQQLTDDNFDAVVALAQLPDLVRGYEEVKVASVDRYRAALRSAVEELEGHGVAVLAS